MFHALSLIIFHLLKLINFIYNLGLNILEILDLLEIFKKINFFRYKYCRFVIRHIFYGRNQPILNSAVIYVTNYESSCFKYDDS